MTEGASGVPMEPEEDLAGGLLAEGILCGVLYVRNGTLFNYGGFQFNFFIWKWRLGKS